MPREARPVSGEMRATVSVSTDAALRIVESDIAAITAASRAAQGLPARVEDESALTQVAMLAVADQALDKKRRVTR